MSGRTQRVLIVGRSGSVLIDTVRILRDRRYAANASNQFDTLLDDYDLREPDLIIFGGMVPPEARAHLLAEVRTINPQVRFMQGMGGIAALVAAQVEEHFGGGVAGVEYVAAARVFDVTLEDTTPVLVEGLWATFVPPEPVAHSAVAFDGTLDDGLHQIAIPDEVPRQGSYAIVHIGPRVSAFQTGETPESVRRIVAAQSLPEPEPVTTRLPWD
jgi:hypothetical protein